MSSFRSRQRANQRRDLTSRERSANSPAGGNQNPPSAGDKPPRFEKRHDASNPRAPYSGQRPGPGKPDWKQQPRQGERSFDKRGPDQRPPQEGGFQDKRYDRDRGPSGRKPMPADNGAERAPAFRREDPSQDKRYSRDRGPSGRKPLHTDDAPRQFKPRAEGDKAQWQRRDDNSPRQSFGKPEGERDSRFRRDDKPQWQNRDDRAPRNDRPQRDDNGPRKPFGKPEGERDSRFRRDDKPQWQNRDDNGPRKPFGKPEGERDNRFRRDDKPQWQPREDRQLDARAERAPRDENAPRKLFGKAEGSSDTRPPREDKPQWQPREDRHERAPRNENVPRQSYADRDNRFRRDDKPQWQPREDRQHDARAERAPRDENAPRKPLFSKPSAERDSVERDNRFRREDHHDERPRQHPSQGLQPFGDSHRVDSPERRQQFDQRRHDKPQWQTTGNKPEITVTGRLDSKLALFAPCPRGLEQLLADELLALGAGDIAPADGGVAFGGDARLMMAVNLHSRTASRVLLRLAHGPYHAEQDIYRLALSVDWPRWFDVSRTIKLKADGIAAQVKSLDYIALTVKDAICDRFRQAQLGRPNVDTRAPDVRVNVFLTADTATVYLDTSGEPLFKRGWREEAGEAPLRENLAAGILMLAGYDGDKPLIDPMCGSGTFLVEAADIALNRAPGRNRRFGFEALASFDQVGWESLQLAARQAEKAPAALDIRGSDRDKKMIAIARANLERAGLSGLVEAKPDDILDVRPGAEAGLIVSNPPYGVRLDELDQLAEWYPLLGDWLKAHFAGWTACLFSGDLRLGKLIHLSPKRRTPLYNGSLACRLFVINMVEGSARKQKNDDAEAAGAELPGEEL
ncbi:hypothetical protein BI347_05155 [Chromobacterium sphagni]|uniref:THUMP domain-containing protein n=1 Tax=Chromobacterium sphagni TaxID=1903179 RepID=A0A1S1X198_9NEIS|nr:hypothetical protein BI347_05155 [Chromobacterium sphagni]